MIVIPNNIFLTLPIHMARLEGNYLYEKGDYRYLPNLHFLNFKKRKSIKDSNDLTIFYLCPQI